MVVHSIWILMKLLWHWRIVIDSLVLERQRVDSNDLRPGLRSPARTHAVAFGGLTDRPYPLVDHILPAVAPFLSSEAGK